MRIKTLDKRCGIPGKDLLAGTEYDIDERYAHKLIASGLAVSLESETASLEAPKAKKKRGRPKKNADGASNSAND